ncbi:MAG: nitroreductase family protein [Candidatus Omnitrophica bacterium]|nr:nitroreductase family protein [Candidatus Omnitrophota bacterium]
MDTKEFLEIVKTRKSIRKFLKKPIAREIIEDIIDTARLAPTANNIQPWEFVVVSDERTKIALSELANYGRFIKDSACCIVVFCKDTKYYLEDGSAATENILLSAHSFGLGACWVAGDKKPYCEEVKKLLSVPAEYKLISLIPIGYPAEKPVLHDKREIRKVMHWERF